MPDEINLHPHWAIRSGRDLHAAGQRLAWSRRAAGDRIEQGNAQRPWGDDDLGAAFAGGKGGEPGYLTLAGQALDVWTKAAEHTERIGVAVVASAEALVDTDTGMSAQMTVVQRKA